MKIVIELDDFSPKNSNLGLLEDLKDHYKDFKITLFTTPWEIRWGEATPITGEKFQPFVEAVKKAEGWIEIALHGLTHVPGEFRDITYDEARKRIIVTEKMFINRGIKYAKIFKAPHWELSLAGERAAMELGFRVVKDGYYNWNLKDEMPEIKGTIIAHGHIQNTMGNGLEEVMPKLLKIPPGTKFMWLSEYLKAPRIDPKKLLKMFPNFGKEAKYGR
jgi:hypothetical protein